MDCRVCAAPVVPYVTKNGFDVLKCTRCGFGQTDCTQEQISSFYDKAYFAGERAHFGQEEHQEIRPSHRWWIEKQLAQMKKKTGLRVLEIGPGLGGPIAGYFQKQRPDVDFAAIEFSDYAADRLRARGMNVFAGRVMDPAILEQCRGRFDLVYGTEVIEHDLEPHAFARAVHDMLVPGGRTAFTTGNLSGGQSRRNKADWYYMDPPAHVSFYTPEAAKHLFAAEGFTGVRVMRYGFNHMTWKLKTHLPGLLLATHLANVSTGMTISAVRK